MVVQEIRLFLLGIGAFGTLPAPEHRSQKFVHYTHIHMLDSHQAVFPPQKLMNMKLQVIIMDITKKNRIKQVRVEFHLKLEREKSHIVI